MTSLAALAAVVIVVATVAACRSSAPSVSSDGAYYARLEKVDADFAARAKSASQKRAEGNSIAEDKAGLEAYAETVRVFAEELGKIGPPTGLADLHANFLATTQGLQHSVDSWAAATITGQSEEEADRLATDSDGKALAVEHTCDQLQSRATANHVDVDLSCRTLTYRNADATP